MIAFDTNLLVRLATNDVPLEREAVTKLIDSQRVLIPVTVLLECEWVLRSRYDYSPADFCSFVRFLDGLANITMDRIEAVRDALNAHEKGCDFADALHCLSQKDIPLITLDKGLVKKGRRLGLQVEALSN